MKKTVLAFVCAAVMISFMSFSCSNSPSTPATPTATPVSAVSDLSIHAAISQDTGLSTFSASVTLKLDSTSADVSGAVVTMNGHILTETGVSGYYSILGLPGAAGGVTVNLVITSAAGNATGSVTIPSTATLVFGTIIGGINSTFMASHN